MALTTAQQTSLRNSVNADGTLNTLPHNSDSAQQIADVYNATDASNTSVWWTAADVNKIFDAITWANFTPNDAADSTVTYSNRSLNIQTKQMNLQNMLVGRATVNAALVNFRAGIRDAVINLPSGTAGAPVSAGGASGATVLTACIRPTTATKMEKLVSAGPSTTGTVTADVLTFEGRLSYQDVMTAMQW